MIFKCLLYGKGPVDMKVRDSPQRHIQSNDFLQGCQDHSVGKGQSLKLDKLMQKNKVGPLPYTLFKC